MRRRAPLRARVGHRHRRQQRLGVRVRRAGRRCSSAGADLDDLAEVHHRHPVGDVAHHRQVVGDEHVGQAELVLQILEQVDDAGLDRHVERRHRLVEHEQLGLERERPGDADALALTAGELVRVAAGVLGLEADELQQLARPAPAAVGLQVPCIRSGSATIASTVMRGSSEAYGSWNTICIAAPELRSSVAGLRVSTSMPSKQHLPDVGCDQPQQQPAGGGLAAARLPHQAERLAADRVEADTSLTAWTAPTRRAGDSPPRTGKSLTRSTRHLQERIGHGRHGVDGRSCAAVRRQLIDVGVGRALPSATLDHCARTRCAVAPDRFGRARAVGGARPRAPRANSRAARVERASGRQADRATAAGP